VYQWVIGFYVETVTSGDVPILAMFMRLYVHTFCGSQCNMTRDCSLCWGWLPVSRDFIQHLSKDLI